MKAINVGYVLARAGRKVLRDCDPLRNSNEIIQQRIRHWSVLIYSSRTDYNGTDPSLLRAFRSTGKLQRFCGEKNIDIKDVSGQKIALSLGDLLIGLSKKAKNRSLHTLATDLGMPEGQKVDSYLNALGIVSVDNDLFFVPSRIQVDAVPRNSVRMEKLQDLRLAVIEMIIGRIGADEFRNTPISVVGKLPLLSRFVA